MEHNSDTRPTDDTSVSESEVQTLEVEIVDLGLEGLTSSIDALTAQVSRLNDNLERNQQAAASLLSE